MFFRFYILILLVSLVLLFTPVWVMGIIVILWFMLDLVRMPSYYIRWKKYQANLYPKTLSFCIKSMRIQKQNFKIIGVLIRTKSLQRTLKKLSILMDDINVRSMSNFDYNLYSAHFDHESPFTYSRSYSDCPENIYH